LNSRTRIAHFPPNLVKTAPNAELITALWANCPQEFGHLETGALIAI
jgi:hypothetical protein